MDLHRIQHRDQHLQAVRHRIDDIKERLFVLLHIFIICEAQPFLHRQQRHQIPIDTSALTADELTDIRVLLLWHDAGAGGKRIVQLTEAKFPGTPQDDLLTDPRQMHHQDRAVGCQLHAIIPIRHPVHRIVGDLRKAQLFTDIIAVDRIGRRCQRSAAQRHLIHQLKSVVQPHTVSAQHVAIRHIHVCQRDRLCPLQMRVARHHGGQMFPCLRTEHFDQIQQERMDLRDFFLDIHPHVQRHLIVAGTCGVQPFPRITDPIGELLFHKGVDVLCPFHHQCARFDVRQDRLQAFDDRFAIRLADDRLSGQHLRMGDRTGDVLPIQPTVKWQRSVEHIQAVIGFLCEPSCPKLCHRLLHARQIRFFLRLDRAHL